MMKPAVSFYVTGRQSHRIQGKIQTFFTLLNFGHTSATCPMYIVCYLLFIFVVLLIIVLIIVVYSAYSFYCIIYIGYTMDMQYVIIFMPKLLNVGTLV